MPLWQGVHKVTHYIIADVILEHKVFYGCYGLLQIYFSLSGLTRHKAVCVGEPGVLPGPSLQFRCSACHRTFSEKRYLKQHMGTNKCERRSEFLENTGSFSLALTESPAQPRSLSVSSVNSTWPDAEKVKIEIFTNIFDFNCIVDLLLLLLNQYLLLNLPSAY